MPDRQHRSARVVPTAVAGLGHRWEGAATADPETGRIDRFLIAERPTTPCIIIDLDRVRTRYRTLCALFPSAGVYYAVKANPAAEIVGALASLGAAFDLASAGEIDRCRSLGIAAERLSFGNTIKREAEIARAHAEGIDLFAFDSPAELEKLARAAPGARVFCRMLVHGHGAEWPLTRKFGCDRRTAIELLVRARQLGLRPVGASFHVGSQQTDPGQWRLAIAHAAEIFRGCARQGVALELLNLGGGLPAQYRTPVPDLPIYAETIEAALVEQFSGARPQILIEPGRCLVGDAGILRAEVLLIARRRSHPDRRWVYLDAGRYNGLSESLGERIQYRLRTPHADGPGEAVILAGPTCDSTDILYERAGYELPLELSIGDPVDFLSAGAYTASYASVEFNGFPPIRTYCL
jgi:ornithine decarboxylase